MIGWIVNRVVDVLIVLMYLRHYTQIAWINAMNCGDIAVIWLAIAVMRLVKVPLRGILVALRWIVLR